MPPSPDPGQAKGSRILTYGADRHDAAHRCSLIRVVDLLGLLCAEPARVESADKDTVRKLTGRVDSVRPGRRRWAAASQVGNLANAALTSALRVSRPCINGHLAAVRSANTQGVLKGLRSSAAKIGFSSGKGRADAMLRVDG